MIVREVLRSAGNRWWGCALVLALSGCPPRNAGGDKSGAAAPSEAARGPAPAAALSLSPASLFPGPGLIPYLQVAAVGTQNYTCLAPGGGGAAAWSPAIPEATLYARDGGMVGRHFGGPSWEWSADRSTFVASKAVAEGFVSVPSPDDAGADVPWLLLPRKAGADAGVLAPAVFVQRLNTLGGAVTNQPLACDPAAADGGLMVKVPYRATYLFYRRGAAQ